MSAAPDYAGHILGWRSWLVVRAGSRIRLSSVVHDAIWEPRQELVSECLASSRPLLSWRRSLRSHVAPDAGCACGIYGGREPAVASQYLELGRARWRVVWRVIGLVALWGRVLECERGWRAERAYPARIYVPLCEEDGRGLERAEDLAHSLAAYGVPVEIAWHRSERELVDSLG